MDPNELTDELKGKGEAMQTSEDEDNDKEQLNLDDLDAAAGGLDTGFPQIPR